MKYFKHWVRVLPAMSVLAISFLYSLSGTVQAQKTPSSGNHPGQAVYKQHCAICHDRPEETRAPAFESLTEMTAKNIDAALTTGKMVAQGNNLTAEERKNLLGFLTTLTPKSEGDDWIANMRCDKPRKDIDYDNVSVRGFGFDIKNSRYLTAEQAGLKTADFKSMELAWAMAFPGVTSMRSQPAVVDNMVYLPVAENSKVYAIDVSGEPCLQWVYESDAILRSGAAFGEQKNGRKIIAINDYNAAVQVLDAKTGELLWKDQLGASALSKGTGTPAIYDGVVYVPVSQIEIMIGSRESYVCCNTHGVVMALDATTGKRIWEAHTMEDAKPIRDRGDGQMLWGPSGAPIWNSPVIDEKRGLLYVGTGEATSAPAHKHTDAILAIDLKDGNIVWSFQATENDIFLAGCSRGSKSLNCEKDTVYRDVDFGASMIIGTRSDGSDVLLGAQKSGTVWALDPDLSLSQKEGKVLWTQQFGEGSPIGGIHWGIAYDGEQVYAPINRVYPGVPPVGSTEKPGIHAINALTGERQWTYQAKPSCEGERGKRVKNCERNIGLSGAPTVIDGAVVTGSLDGFLFAFDAKTGEILFQYNVARDFETVNGVKGKGGSFDSAGIVASDGLLLVNSGYAAFGETPGNVLLAFKPKKAK